MCKNCKPQPCNNCLEIEEAKCADLCDDVLSTDCIFHNVPATDPTAKLFNIGVTKGSSLKYILKKIDARLGLLLTSDFSSYNTNGLGNIDNIKQFIELVTAKIKTLVEKDEELTTDIENLETDLEAVSDTIEDIIKIKVSSSLININNTDELRTVLLKLISYVEDIQMPEQLSFTDTASIAFSQSGNQVSASFKISEVSGNTLILKDDGVYNSNPSISSLLTLIKEQPELKEMFDNLVKDSIPTSNFEIMSDTNQIINYVGKGGVALTATAKANTLLKLKNVQLIKTTPTAGLQITYKGIQ